MVTYKFSELSRRIMRKQMRRIFLICFLMCFGFSGCEKQDGLGTNENMNELTDDQQLLTEDVESSDEETEDDEEEGLSYDYTVQPGQTKTFEFCTKPVSGRIDYEDRSVTPIMGFYDFEEGSGKHGYDGLRDAGLNISVIEVEEDEDNYVIRVLVQVELSEDFDYQWPKRPRQGSWTSPTIGFTGTSSEGGIAMLKLWVRRNGENGLKIGGNNCRGKP